MKKATCEQVRKTCITEGYNMREYLIASTVDGGIEEYIDSLTAWDRIRNRCGYGLSFIKWKIIGLKQGIINGLCRLANKESRF